MMTTGEIAAVETLRPLLEAELHLLDKDLRDPKHDPVHTAYLRGRASQIDQLLTRHAQEVAIQMLADTDEPEEAHTRAQRLIKRARGWLS